MIEPDIQTKWIWSDLDFKLIKVIEVSLIVRGNLGSQMDIEGPIQINNFSDFHECWEILKERLFKKLNANLDQ